MKATTIKLDGALLKAIEAVKSTKESVSAYVRRAVEASIRKSRMHEAGLAYQKFLTKNPKETAWLREWSEADLDKGSK